MPLTRQARSSIVRTVMGSNFFMGRFFVWNMMEIPAPSPHPCDVLPFRGAKKTTGKLGSEKGPIAPQPGGCGKFLAPSRKRLSHYSHAHQICLTTGERSATQ